MANEINEGIDIFAGIDELDVENEVASVVEETPKTDLFDEPELKTEIQEEPQPKEKQEVKTEEKVKIELPCFFV